MTRTLTMRIVEHGSAEYGETVALRDDVLRRPLGLVFTPEDLGSESGEYHLACYAAGDLVGCLVLAPQNDSALKMRQVAVAEAMQQRGIGKAMVAFSEQFARKQGFTTITMHARDTAVPFYEQLGYQRVGEMFMEVTIPHYVMQKNIM